MVENASDEEIQNKPELIASLYSSIGNAYLELSKTEKAMEFHQKDLDLAREKLVTGNPWNGSPVAYVL